MLVNLPIALSVSRPIVDVLRTSSGAWRVLSTHPRACNLCTENGTFVALVAAPYNGPFHVRVPPAALASLSAASRVYCADGYLRWEQGGIDLTAASIWEPRVHWPDAPLAAHAAECLAHAVFANHQTSIFHPASSPSSVAEQRMVAQAQAGAHHVRVGLQQESWSLMAAGVNKLAGLGPGLTPAGDDFLLGVMAGLWTFQNGGSTKNSVENLCARIGERAAQRTTRLSAAWLHHAVHNEFSEPWHDLARALRSADCHAVGSTAQRILAVGATSGADALQGFISAAQSAGAWLSKWCSR